MNIIIYPNKAPIIYDDSGKRMKYVKEFHYVYETDTTVLGINKMLMIHGTDKLDHSWWKTKGWEKLQ